MTNNPQKAEGPWWERLTDSSSDADSGRRALKMVVIVAIIVLVGVSISNFFDSSEKKADDNRAKILEAGLVLLPDREDVNYGRLPDGSRTSLGRMQTIPSAFLRSHPGLMGRDSVASPISEPDAASAYADEVEQAIQSLTDRKSEFSDEKWEARYLHTLQQLHFYAAINSLEDGDRRNHFDAQIAILDDLKARFAKDGLLGIKPLPTKPDMTVLDLYYAAATAEREFYKDQSIKATLQADKNLKISIELDNGKTLELESFSQVAPKALQVFVNNAQSGLYDGTAFHALDADAGTFTGGGPYSRDYPNRKSIWGTENPGFGITMEATSLLPTKRGAVSLFADSTLAHGLFFQIHTIDPDEETANVTVFARVTKGLEALDDWLETEVHDEASLTNKKLPRVRLGIKKVTVTGTLDHPSIDSWKPVMQEMKPGPETAAEKAFMESLKKAKDDKPEKQGDTKKDDSDTKDK